MAFRNVDVNTMNCGICLVPLANWPSTDEWATPNLSLMSLPCAHVFHTECICARRVHLERDDRTGSLEAIAVPCVSESCPLCRASWTPETATEHILGDFEDYQSEEDEDEDDDAHDDGFADAEVVWTRYADPESHRVFWAKPDAWEGGGDAAFWEDSDDLWKYHADQTGAGEDYWAHVNDVHLYFYVSSGTRKSRSSSELP